LRGPGPKALKHMEEEEEVGHVQLQAARCVCAFGLA
jgi:hypothetical protein